MSEPDRGPTPVGMLALRRLGTVPGTRVDTLAETRVMPAVRNVAGHDYCMDAPAPGSARSDAAKSYVPAAFAPRPTAPGTKTMDEPHHAHTPTTAPTGASATLASLGSAALGTAGRSFADLRRPHLNRKALIDWLLWSGAALVAYLTHVPLATLAERWPAFVGILAVAALVRLAVALRFKLYAQSWSRVSFFDLIHIMAALVLAHGLQLVLMASFGRLVPFSLTIWATDLFLSAGALAGIRVVSRYRAERSRDRRAGKATRERKVVLVGAGSAGAMVAREMWRHRERGLTPIAFVDDDPAKQRLMIEGVDVAGTVADLPAVIAERGAHEVVISISMARGPLVRRVQDLVGRTARDVTVRVMPGMLEMLSGDVLISRLRTVHLEDLLHREPVPLQLEPIRSYVDGACVMVTGAGGSIGSELVRQLTRVSPRQLVLVGCGENSLFEINQELLSRGVTTPLAMVVADVSNRERMRQVFERWRPSVVFPAAAHKHVPLMEENPEEAFFNNVVGTRNVAELCAQYDVERFVNVSTDKAVRPSSVMGASKRMAEAVVKEVAQRAGLKGRLVSVRFGNVLGSRGSVVPTFQRQIAAGGPVTVTDPDMQRYFMTIPEACQLLLQAAADPVNASTYLLDMGSPVRILDLAEQLIRLSGLTPYEDIAIEFTGRRPGEKLYEELTTEFESSQVTNNPRIVVVSATDLHGAPLREVFDSMRGMAERGEGERLRRELVALFGREYVLREDADAVPPGEMVTGRPREHTS